MFELICSIRRLCFVPTVDLILEVIRMVIVLLQLHRLLIKSMFFVWSIPQGGTIGFREVGASSGDYGLQHPRHTQCYQLPLTIFVYRGKSRSPATGFQEARTLLLVFRARRAVPNSALNSSSTAKLDFPENFPTPSPSLLRRLEHFGEFIEKKSLRKFGGLVSIGRGACCVAEGREYLRVGNTIVKSSKVSPTGKGLTDVCGRRHVRTFRAADRTKSSAPYTSRCFSATGPQAEAKPSLNQFLVGGLQFVNSLTGHISFYVVGWLFTIDRRTSHIAYGSYKNRNSLLHQPTCTLSVHVLDADERARKTVSYTDEFDKTRFSVLSILTETDASADVLGFLCIGDVYNVVSHCITP
ncbi:unnamed protein product, partial [Nesidiocoris tenuis]